MKNVLILGAGFAGLELATVLSDEVPDEVDVTIVDSSDAFVFGFSKLDLMFGRKDLARVRVPYSHLDKPSVRFVQETVVSIDPESRRVTTNAATYEPDILVVALGADLDPAATPGMVEEGSEFYTVEGADRVSELLPAFPGGDVIIGVLGNFFKCPAAPFETAFMLHDYLENRGLRATSTIKIVSPMGSPIPISPEASAGILEAAGNGTLSGAPSRRSSRSILRPKWPHSKTVGRCPTASSSASRCTGLPRSSRTRPWPRTGGSPSTTGPLPRSSRTSTRSAT